MSLLAERISPNMYEYLMNIKYLHIRGKDMVQIWALSKAKTHEAHDSYFKQFQKAVSNAFFSQFVINRKASYPN